MMDVLRLSVPLTAWLAGFSAVYALQGLSCSRHWPPDLPMRPTLVAAWALCIALQAILVWILWRTPSPSPFVRRTSLALAGTALIAAIWTTGPVVLASLCL